MRGGLVHMLLIHLCSNYPPSDVTTTTPPPWQWVYGFPYEDRYHNDTSFRCKLKKPMQLQNELLKGKKLRVGTLPDQKPMSWVTTNNKTGKLEGHGIAFEILNTLSAKYEFSYEIILPSRKTLLDQDGSIMNILKTGEVDMVAAFVPVLNIKKNKMAALVKSEEEELKLQLQQEEAMKWKWGIELGQSQYVVMMKRPHESATGSGLLAPFEIEVWFLILISLVLIGPIMHAIMRVRRWLSGTQSELYPISACTWFVYGALMKQGSTLNPRTGEKN
ncbi:hypothetical protein M8J76_014282 [Diaphorina citri]|nr:hypothetical protein M8J76_014282 [Diaphorina citri]KAI5738574.1 hypothetical protein M8J77_008648 [Diaphorina citri]